MNERDARLERIKAVYAADLENMDDPATLLWWLLMELRVFADANGLDFGRIDRDAYREGYLQIKAEGR